MTAAQLVFRTQERLVTQWRQPVYRSAYVLAGGTLLTAVSGIAFWLLAARLYPPEVTGSNAIAVSTMLLLSGVAQLNLMSALLRFVPTAGPAAGRMIGLSYVVSGALSALAAGVFLAGLHVWAPGLSALLSPAPIAASFVLGSAVWAVYAMQSSALIAVGRTTLATALGQGFNLLKLALLAAFVVLLPSSGIWSAWTAAAAVVTGTGTWVLFRHALPAFAKEPDVPEAAPSGPRLAPSPSDLARFAVPDYVAALAWIAATSLVPIMVLNLTDAAHAAVFSLAWSACYVLYSVPAAFGQSLVAHVVREPSRLQERHRQLLLSTLGLLAPVVLVLVWFAPQLLTLFGPWYSSNGALTLRLLALSTLPNAVVALTISHARVMRHMAVVMATMLGVSSVVLSLTWLLVPRMGIVGAAWAWLAAEVAVATAIGVEHLAQRLVRMPARVRGTAPLAQALGLTRQAGWRVQRSMRTVSDSTVLLLTSPSGDAALKVAATGRGVAVLRREGAVLSRLAAEPSLERWRHTMPTVLDECSLPGGHYLLLHRISGHPAQAGTDLDLVAAAIAPLHRIHPEEALVDESLLDDWVNQPSARLRRALSGRRRGAQLDRLVATLRGSLQGRTVTLSWLHGDYYPGNVLTGPAGEVAGIIDWGQARERELAVLDLATWLLTSSGNGSLGDRVAARLERTHCWDQGEREFLDTAPGGRQVPDASVLLLAWLRHVDNNLVKSARYATSPIWLRRNVFPVLKRFDGD